MDETEGLRKVMVAVINAAPGSRESLESEHGKVWDTDQLRSEFEVIGFMAPMIGVKRKSDGKKGSMLFQHSPRFYFHFMED